MKQLFTCLLVVLFIDLPAQLIYTKPVEVNVGPDQFSPLIVKQSRIKSIQVMIVDKPDGAMIIDKGATQGYDFDEHGRVIRYYYTILNKIELQEVEIPAIRQHGRVVQAVSTQLVAKYINDTIFANIFYDNQSRIITKRVRMGDYYDAYYYEYNEQGQIKKETHCKETNVSENKKEFKMGVQTILSAETFQYTALTPAQIRKECFNDEGRAYKKAIINYDAKGSKLSENYEFIVSWMRQENSYKYDSKGNLLERISTSNESGNLKQYTVYDYDPNGVLLSEKRFKNDVLLNEISYLYDETKTLVKSSVNRDHKNSSIGIVKYNYNFY